MDQSSQDGVSAPESDVLNVNNGPLHRGTEECMDPDAEGIALLREIFPEKSDGELRELHHRRLGKNSSEKQQQQPRASGPTSKLGRRIWNQTMILQEVSPDEALEPLHWQDHALPDDFLRLPIEVAIRQHNERKGRWEYYLVAEMEERVLKQHQNHHEIVGGRMHCPFDDQNYSRVLIRQPKIGLGMTLCEQNGCVWVHSLVGKDGCRWYMAPPDEASGGPALHAGIQPGDWLLGIQGQALLPMLNGSLLQYAVSAIQHTPDPVVLHLRHIQPHQLHSLMEGSENFSSDLHNSPSLLDTTVETLDASFLSEDDQFDVGLSNLETENKSSSVTVHPFVAALALRGLIKPMADQIAATKRLEQYTTRTRQWESTSSFRIDADTFALRHHFDPKDLPPTMLADNLPFDYSYAKNIRPYAPSTPMLNPAVDLIPQKHANPVAVNSVDEEGADVEQYGLLGQPSYPGARTRETRAAAHAALLESSDIFIPLIGVRKGLCVRILNSFLDDNRAAYTIWVYDVESGREWYAPVRYLRDFRDLRSATVSLCPRIAQLPFPASPRWISFGNNEKTESQDAREGKCLQLEQFLRELCTLIYTDPLHPGVAEVAIHVQSFLGCDIGLGDMDQDLHLQNQVVMSETMWGQKAEDGHSDLHMSARLLLKRSIQRYTYRLFLLDCVKDLNTEFVDKVRSTAPRLNEIEALEAKGRNALKERALEELEKIQTYLDQLQDLIIGACMDDFRSIAQRRDFFALRDFFDGHKGSTYLDRIIRESVREQIEIEVYVPLRSVVSRLLVQGFRHDDMEMHFKMQVLRGKPQSYFNIPVNEQSRSEWRSVSSVMNEGIGMSTLPCAKLRAIVDAAREIFRVYSAEQDQSDYAGRDLETSEDEFETVLEGPTLTADNFLPIFIFAVVRAELERPSALCVLLRTLCDRTNRIGEIGYYLASFEAAITHIQEIDLSLDQKTANFLPRDGQASS